MAWAKSYAETYPTNDFVVGGKCAACHQPTADLIERGRLAMCAECVKKYDELTEGADEA